ncbi:hypothetical protein [Ferrimicrobium acidiphilum]|uniref:TraG/VirB4 family ATPase n=1 Tax=Ferrimicrobium acidiphilum TaxID=121039 RepID=UPI0023F3F1B5|nr:hypothetical protein [Ferrimicrobium acidiphilum]
MKVDGYRLTTRNSASIYPWQAQPGRFQEGIIIGPDDLAGGAVFCFDPWALYEKVITSPNMFVFGQPGKGKSSFLKTYLMREFAFDRNIYVIDPKGEYGPVGEALNIPVVYLRPGGTVKVNPLQAFGAEADNPSAAFIRRSEMMTAILEVELGRELQPAEKQALSAALHGISLTATLGDLIKLFFDPTPEMVEEMHTTRPAVIQITKSLGYTLDRLITGPLQGMFDGETTLNMDQASRGLIINLESVFDTTAMRPVMVCATSWISGLAVKKDRRQKIIAVDEAWAIMDSVETTRWLQARAKLSRAHGIQLLIATHGISDLSAQASAGSEAAKQALGLLRDTETKVLFGQDNHDEIKQFTEALNLSEREAKIVASLRQGEALWRVGRYAFRVTHLRTANEQRITDTSANMKPKKNKRKTRERAWR